MKLNEIIEMAREAGFDCYGKHITWDDVICTDELKAFAKLVAEKEREACALICDEFFKGNKNINYSDTIAICIRARAKA
jgi:F420-0:gamma-glutamyl ligase